MFRVTAENLYQPLYVCIELDQHLGQPCYAGLDSHTYTLVLKKVEK